jgi:hypothetical protein
MMKSKVYLLLCGVLALNVTGFSQETSQTLVIRPGSEGKDASLQKENPTMNNGADENIICNAWTSGGPFTQRTVFAFSYSGLPANAVIQSATLSLYCNTTSQHTQRHSSFPNSPYNTTNEAYISRVTSPWSEGTVTWGTMPTTTTTHRVNVPASISETQDYTIDVTQLVKDELQNAGNSHGFMLELQNEATYRSLIFASSDHPDATKRPKLVINYLVPQSVSTATQGATFSITPNPAEGVINVALGSRAANGNVTIQLVDVTGKIVAQQQAENQASVQVPVANLPRGAYWVKVSGQGMSSSEKVILQ